MEQLGSHWTYFHEIWYLKNFWKSSEKIKVSLKSDKSNGNLTRRPTHIFDNISLKMFQTNACRENRNTHFTLSNFFLIKCRLWDNVEKQRTAGETTDDDTAHAHWMDWIGYKIHAQAVWSSLLSYINNTRTNAPGCYVARTLPVFQHFKFLHSAHVMYLRFPYDSSNQHQLLSSIAFANRYSQGSHRLLREVESQFCYTQQRWILDFKKINPFEILLKPIFELKLWEGHAKKFVK